MHQQTYVCVHVYMGGHPYLGALNCGEAALAQRVDKRGMRLPCGCIRQHSMLRLHLSVQVMKGVLGVPADAHSSPRGTRALSPSGASAFQGHTKLLCKRTQSSAWHSDGRRHSKAFQGIPRQAAHNCGVTVCAQARTHVRTFVGVSLWRRGRAQQWDAALVALRRIILVAVGVSLGQGAAQVAAHVRQADGDAHGRLKLP